MLITWSFIVTLRSGFWNLDSGLGIFGASSFLNREVTATGSIDERIAQVNKSKINRV